MKGDICKVDGCYRIVVNKHGKLCGTHRYRWEKYKDYGDSILIKPTLSHNIVKICKIHGQLNKDQIYKRHDSSNSLKCKKCQQKWTYNYSKNHSIKYKQRSYYKYNEKTKLTRMKSRLMIQHKMTLEEYNSLLIKQNHVCAICKNPEKKVDYRRKTLLRLSVDHCHDTGKIRGLLCDRCNISIGRFEDSIEILEHAIDYLKKNNK